MDEILRQKDAELKAAVRASLAGDVRGAFEKLGDRVAEVKPDNLAGAAAARWLGLSPEQRENTGRMAPSHELRQAVNGHIRERLARDGAIHGAALDVERLVSYGYTGAEKSLAANYAPGDVVAFHRAYRSLGVEKGEERRVARVDRARGTVILEGGDGETVHWQPRRVGGRRGAVEVYRAEGIALRAGSAGSGTTPGSASSTATPPRSRRFGGAASPSGSKTGGGPNSRTRNSDTWITPGRPPCMRSRGARSTTSLPSWRRTIRT